MIQNVRHDSLLEYFKQVPADTTDPTVGKRRLALYHRKVHRPRVPVQAWRDVVNHCHILFIVCSVTTSLFSWLANLLDAKLPAPEVVFGPVWEIVAQPSPGGTVASGKVARRGRLKCRLNDLLSQIRGRRRTWIWMKPSASLSHWRRSSPTHVATSCRALQSCPPGASRPTQGPDGSWTHWQGRCYSGWRQERRRRHRSQSPAAPFSARRSGW